MLRKSLTLLLISLFLSSCNGFFETDNTPEPAPLTKYTPRLKPQLHWSAHVAGSKSEAFVRQNPVIADDMIFATNTGGYVAAFALRTGKSLWQTNTGVRITSGVGVGNGLVAVGGHYGEVIVLAQSDGQILWKKQVSGEILAAPAIRDNIVLVKTAPGQVHAFSGSDGHHLWTYKQKEPNLILRGASSPLLRDDHAYIGFANGNLAKINIANGHASWVQRIAVPRGAFGIDQMIDIDADPVIHQNHLYAATYQGKIASLSQMTGDVRWDNDISSYTGMIADSDHVYVTDAKGSVWSFNVADGEKVWQQDELKNRILTAPTLQESYLVVGDAQGYLHWIDKHNGQLLARQYLNAPMYASPVMQDGMVYALTNNGALYAFSLNGNE